MDRKKEFAMLQAKARFFQLALNGAEKDMEELKQLAFQDPLR